jgi:hypothetical protein
MEDPIIVLAKEGTLIVEAQEEAVRLILAVEVIQVLIILLTQVSPLVGSHLIQECLVDMKKKMVLCGNLFQKVMAP